MQKMTFHERHKRWGVESWPEKCEECRAALPPTEHNRGRPKGSRDSHKRARKRPRAAVEA